MIKVLPDVEQILSDLNGLIDLRVFFDVFEGTDEMLDFARCVG